MQENCNFHAFLNESVGPWTLKCFFSKAQDWSLSWAVPCLKDASHLYTQRVCYCVNVPVPYCRILSYHTGQLVLTTSLKTISPTPLWWNACCSAHMQHPSMHACMRLTRTHTYTHKHAHMCVVSMVSGVSPASLNLRSAMNDHMEVFFLVRPSGLLHDSSPGTTCAFLWHTDGGCFEHWFVVKATCRRNIAAAHSIAGWHKSPQTTHELPATPPS